MHRLGPAHSSCMVAMTNLKRTFAFISPDNERAAIVSILAALLICSATLNILLARKAENLGLALAEAEAEGVLKIGAVLPQLEVRDSSGSLARINYAGSERPTVLHVISPQCVWCTRNIPNMKALAEHAKGEYRLITISLSDAGLREYIGKYGLAEPIYGGIPDSEKLIYKLHGTPQTIVVSPEGKVLKHWKGAYSGNTQAEVEEYFHLRLPGLAEVGTDS